MSVRSLVKVFKPSSDKSQVRIVTHLLRTKHLIGQTQKLIGSNLFMSSKCSLHERSKMAKT